MASTDSNAAHGKDFQSFIDDELRTLKHKGFLTHVIKEFRAREPGFGNPEQYYAPFLIQFNDRTRWILFSTTSMRTDRIKGQQWDADRLKHVDATISKALLVYPDDVTGRVMSEFIRQKAKYDDRWEFSRIDDIIPFAELVRQIKKLDEEIQQESIGLSVLRAEVQPLFPSFAYQNYAVAGKSLSSSTDQGRAWDIGGRNFERYISTLLSDQALLKEWKSGVEGNSQESKSFSIILDSLPIEKSSVISITATSDKDEIGLLPSGGSPKTDVIAKVKLTQGRSQTFTFSCKRSTKNQVSAHQYSADAFANVLDSGNDNLRSLLNTFQIYGNKMNFPTEDAVALEKQLSDKVEKLCQWVVGGYGGEGESHHLAEYVITYRVDKEKLSVHTTNDYVKAMMASSSGFFGTPFQWTFASGQRGKSIQLKMPML